MLTDCGYDRRRRHYVYAFILVTNQEQAIGVAKLAYDESGMKAESSSSVVGLVESPIVGGSIDESQQANRTNRVRRTDTKSPRRRRRTWDRSLKKRYPSYVPYFSRCQ
ncbi:hypothetical protein TTRE_0000106701 [Trichuris trichiura]|uniref:Uncharacterized protein n=1 Tax=Trichuris trichiura TaxID=36087 RepID=A0A077Z2B8_TRITR|nr:hypothetical protein TTRE_0000106701 [Trichuris trichiura]